MDAFPAPVPRSQGLKISARIGGGLSPRARAGSTPLALSREDVLRSPLLRGSASPRRGGTSVFSPPARRRCPPPAIVALILTEAWDTMGIVIILPVLPFFLLLNHHLATVFTVACINAVFSLARVAFKGMLKNFADLVGPKQVIMASLIVSVMCHYEMACHDQPGALLTFRALVGMACAKDMVVTSYVEEHCPDAHERQRIGEIRVKTVLVALCVGVAAGSFVYVHFGWSWLFIGLAIGNVIELVAVMFLLSEVELEPLMEGEQYDIDLYDDVTMEFQRSRARSSHAMHARQVTYDDIEELSAPSPCRVDTHHVLSGTGQLSLQGALEALKDPFVSKLLIHNYLLLAGTWTTVNCLPFLFLSRFDATGAEYGRICTMLALVLVFCCETRISAWQLHIFGERGCILALCLTAALANAWLIKLADSDYAVVRQDAGSLVLATLPFGLVAAFLGVTTRALHTWLERVVTADNSLQTLDLFYASLPLANVFTSPLSGLMYELHPRAPFYLAITLYAAAAIAIMLAPSKRPANASPRRRRHSVCGHPAPPTRTVVAQSPAAAKGDPKTFSAASPRTLERSQDRAPVTNTNGKILVGTN